MGIFPHLWPCARENDDKPVGFWVSRKKCPEKNQLASLLSFASSTFLALAILLVSDRPDA